MRWHAKTFLTVQSHKLIVGCKKKLISLKIIVFYLQVEMFHKFLMFDNIVGAFENVLMDAVAASWSYIVTFMINLKRKYISFLSFCNVQGERIKLRLSFYIIL